MSLLSPRSIPSRERHTIVARARNRGDAVRRAIYAQRFNPNDERESRMLLDTESHWRWSNPAIYLPGLILLLFLVLGMLL